MHKGWLVVFLCLAACTPNQGPSDPGPKPVGYKEKILDAVRLTYFDPYSIRDASITQPFIVPDYNIFRGHWGVCFRANAKNRMGGYTGLKEHLVVFQDHKIIEFSNGGTPDGRGCVGPFSPTSVPG